MAVANTKTLPVCVSPNLVGTAVAPIMRRMIVRQGKKITASMHPAAPTIKTGIRWAFLGVSESHPQVHGAVDTQLLTRTQQMCVFRGALRRESCAPLYPAVRTGTFANDWSSYSRCLRPCLHGACTACIDTY